MQSYCSQVTAANPIREAADDVSSIQVSCPTLHFKLIWFCSQSYKLKFYKITYLYLTSENQQNLMSYPNDVRNEAMEPVSMAMSFLKKPHFGNAKQKLVAGNWATVYCV